LFVLYKIVFLVQKITVILIMFVFFQYCISQTYFFRFFLTKKDAF